MKVNALTAGAVALAAFALYQFMKKPTAGLARTGADVLYAQASSQRREVGNAIWQSTAYADYLSGDYLKQIGMA